MEDSLDLLYRGSARRMSRRRGDDRSTTRMVSAAIVAGGLAFSASLVPVPGLRSPAQLWQQEQEAIAALPGHIRTIVAGRLVNLATMDAPTLAQLVEILHNRFPEVRAEVFRDILANRSLPEIVRTFGILMAAGSPLAASTALFAGAASGGSGDAGVPLPIPDLTSLFQLLLQRMPAYLAHEVIAALFPASSAVAAIDAVTQTLSLPQLVTTAAPPAEPETAPPPAPIAAPPIEVAPPPPAAKEAPPEPAPPSIDVPPTHSYETPVVEVHLPVPDVLPDVPQYPSVVDELGSDDDLGIVGGDEVTGDDDGDSLGDEGDGALSGVGETLDGDDGSDDTSAGAGEPEHESPISAVLGGDDGPSTLSMSRLGASDSDDDGGSDGGSNTGGGGGTRSTDNSGNDSSTGTSDGGHSGDAGSDGD